jgi:hypothetical protein
MEFGDLLEMELEPAVDVIAENQRRSLYSCSRGVGMREPKRRPPTKQLLSSMTGGPMVPMSNYLYNVKYK